MIKHPPKRQKGVALMIVIFVFALVSILSVGMYNRQSLFIQASGNLLAQSQAYQYALASETYGRRLLKADWDEDKDKNEFVDDLEQTKNSIFIPVEDAFLEAQFNDLQGRLNLNDLVLLDNAPNAIMVERFKRLLDRLSIETIKVDVLLDWIDENQEPSNIEGIEDGEYLSQDPPYRNAGQAFAHVSELLLIPGISREDYQNLLPHVSTLPMGRVSINVNTATNEVLQSLSDELSDTQVEELASQRESDPWKDVAGFKADPLVASAKINELNLDVRSEFFEIATRITLADRTVRLVSVIYRNKSDGKMQVLFRDQGRKYLITKDKIAL